MSKPLVVGFACRLRMPRSRTKNPLLFAFGAVLMDMRKRYEVRTRRNQSHLAVARSLTAKLKKRFAERVSIGSSTLFRWETGEVQRLNPIVLKELALLYDTTFDGLLAVLEANLSDPGLTVENAHALLQAAVTSLPTATGAGHGTDREPKLEARLEELREGIERAKARAFELNREIRILSRTAARLAHRRPVVSFEKRS
jgi:transcriptional regulator with XRE-family HTH domain